MTILLADRVQETTSTTGNGTATLNGAPPFFQSFAAAIGTGNTTYYCIFSGDGINWETGVGTVGGAGPYTLSRSVIASSNGNAAISLTGTSTVFCNIPAFGVQMHAFTVANSNTTTLTASSSTQYFMGFTNVLIDTDNISGTAVNLSAAFASTTMQGITVPAAWNGHPATISGNIQVTSNAGGGTGSIGIYRSGSIVMTAQCCTTGGFTNPSRNSMTMPFILQTGDIIFLGLNANATVSLTSSNSFTFTTTASTWLGIHLIG